MVTKMTNDNIDKEYGKMGTLPDGRKVIVRSDSRHGCPIMEIQPLDQKDKIIKIRYEDNKA